MPADLSREEARAEVVMCYHPANFSEDEFLKRLDTLESAVRAATLASLIEKVEALPGLRIVGKETRVGNVTMSAHDTTLANAVLRSDVLTLLRTEAKTDGH